MLCDSSMVAAAITTARLPAGNQVVYWSPIRPGRRAAARGAPHPLGGRRGTVGRPAGRHGTRDRQCATALFRLLELIDEGFAPPVAVLGGPVGFVGSAQSSRSFIDRRAASPVVVTGRRGGSAMAAAAVNAIAEPTRSGRAGDAEGVGLGPGDQIGDRQGRPGNRRGRRGGHHSARHGRSIARGIADPYLRPVRSRTYLVYPVTTPERHRSSGGYAGALEDFYADATRRIAAHLDAGRSVALLAEVTRCLQLLHASAHPADATGSTPSSCRGCRKHRSALPRRPSRHRWWPETRCCRCCRARCQSPN